jgi:hypothetical protein
MSSNAYQMGQPDDARGHLCRQAGFLQAHMGVGSRFCLLQEIG